MTSFRINTPDPDYDTQEYSGMYGDNGYGGKDAGKEKDAVEKEAVAKDYGRKHKEENCYEVKVRKCHECEPPHREPCFRPEPCCRPEHCCRPEPCYCPEECYYPMPCPRPEPWCPPEPCKEKGKEMESCKKEKECKCPEILLAAATGGAGPLPAIVTPLVAPLQIVSLTLDPDRGDDLKALLNFTSVISVPAAVLLTLNFQILRALDDGPAIPIGPTFTFAQAVAALSTFDFGFQVFDKPADARTITYSVVLAAGSLVSVAVGVAVLNATLSVVAKEYNDFPR